MSINTQRTSILKNYASSNRDKIKQTISSKVRFELLRDHSLRKCLEGVEENGDLHGYREFLTMIRDEHIGDNDFMLALQEGRDCVDLLIPKFSDLAHALISLDWLRRSDEVILEYQKFLIDLLSRNNKYTKYAVIKLISNMVPIESDQFLWKRGTPLEPIRIILGHIHETINAIIDVIPLAQEMVLEALAAAFPYIKKTFMVSGYVHNLFWITEYRPAIKEAILKIIIQKMILLDVNTPRNSIEEAEFEEDDEIFEMDLDANTATAEDEDDVMKHPDAETLDICMLKLFDFIKNEHDKENKNVPITKTFQLLMHCFEKLILPVHNSHHVQFILFYYCSFKQSIAEEFANFCWSKAREFNAASSVRQSYIGYLASILARSLFISINVVKEFLQDMCSWIFQYIKRSDSGQQVYSLKSHTAFYATCQAMFYVISFRSRELTSTNQNLIFLQSLQLNTIVTSHLNPLRVCLPAVATAFSGVTRAHQLAYCHTILERNARKKLATIYSNETSMPDECLDTFFPFDQYMLKKSGTRITTIYREYQASEAEEGQHTAVMEAAIEEATNKRRKHLDSANGFNDDMDDFIVDKRLKMAELSKSFDREL